MRMTTRQLLVLFLPLVLLLAACSNTASSPSAAAESAAAPSEEAASAGASPSEAASPSESAAASAEGEGTIALAEAAQGMILVDAEGKTLYGFKPDEGATESQCNDDCAAAWPPLLADDSAAATVGAGLDASLLSTIPRADGSTQVTYGTWPLYYFANDAAAGDVNGQGLNDVWYVVGADGNLIES